MATRRRATHAEVDYYRSRADELLRLLDEDNARAKAAEAEVKRLRRLINEIVIAYSDDENLSALDVAIGRASALVNARADDEAARRG